MDYIIWLVAAVVFSVIEISTANLVTIWFALGSVAAFIASLLGAGTILQMWVFIIITVIALIITKPLVKNKLAKKKIPTNADSLVGETGFVIKEIKKENFAGIVKVKGQEWSAVSEDKSDIEAGCAVEITDINGVKLVVRKIEE